MEFSLATLLPVLLCVVAYLFGSVPFGLVLAKLAGYGDIRAIGSGNIGATNVLRTGNKPLAFATLLLDSGKGAAAVGLGYLIDGESQLPLLMGLCAVIGHIYPVWLGFKGGKGVATALGFILALSWKIGLGMLITWLIIAFIFRYSSLAALVAFVAAPIYAWFTDVPQLMVPYALLAALIIWKHKTNISRLLSASEPKIGAKKKSE